MFKSYTPKLERVDLCGTILQQSVRNLDKANAWRSGGSKSKAFNAV